MFKCFDFTDLTHRDSFEICEGRMSYRGGVQKVSMLDSHPSLFFLL